MPAALRARIDPWLVEAADAHAAFTAVRNEAEAIADEVHRPVATTHILDGDPETRLELVDRKGFAECCLWGATSEFGC